jgi:hypothetical protein
MLAAKSLLKAITMMATINKPTTEEILAPKPLAKPRIPSRYARSLTGLQALRTMIALMSLLRRGIYV